MEVDLSISIVNWNVKNLLEECLDSIFKTTKDLSYEVFVVDNGSEDGSVEMVKNKFPAVKLVENKTNIGFPAANNQAIKLAASKYILLLNPDTVVQKDSLKTMVKFLDDHKDTGALGPRLLNPDGSLQLSCRSFPTLETALYSALFLDQLFPTSKVFGKYLMSFWDHNGVREVDQPMGAALMVRKEAIEKIGLMDDNIKFWFDEVDWCKRIKDAGWKIYFTPEAQIIHYKNQSFGQWRGLKTIIRNGLLWRKSRNYYFKKHYGPLYALAIAMMEPLQIITVIAVFIALIKLFNYLIK